MEAFILTGIMRFKILKVPFNKLKKSMGTVNKESSKEISIEDIERMSVMDIPRRKNNTPVPISANMELLISAAITQNFVPVIDDANTFIKALFICLP